MKVTTKQLTDDLMIEIKAWREIIKNKKDPEVILGRIADRPVYCNMLNQIMLNKIHDDELTHDEMPQYIDMIAADVMAMLAHADDSDHTPRTEPVRIAKIANKMSF